MQFTQLGTDDLLHLSDIAAANGWEHVLHDIRSELQERWDRIESIQEAEKNKKVRLWGDDR